MIKKFNCICCKRVLKAEPTENPMVVPPVYSGIVFRSTGNFGSTVFDPMPIGAEEMLQIVICDECIKPFAKISTIRCLNHSSASSKLKAVFAEVGNIAYE